MFTMAFADILGFILPEVFNDMVQGTTDVKITQGFLLVMAVLVQIPIMMIYLSRILSRKISRWMNIIASIITILFVIVGGSLYLHYIFFACHRSNLHVVDNWVFMEMENRRRYWQGIVDGSAVGKFLVKYRGFTVQCTIIPIGACRKTAAGPGPAAAPSIFSPCGVPAFRFSAKI